MSKARSFAKYQFLSYAKAVLVYYALLLMFAILANSPGSRNTLAGSVVLFRFGFKLVQNQFSFFAGQ